MVNILSADLEQLPFVLCYRNFSPKNKFFLNKGSKGAAKEKEEVRSIRRERGILGSATFIPSPFQLRRKGGSTVLKQS